MKHKLLIILGVFLVSFSAIFVKLLDGIEPSVIAMYRLGIGGLLLLPFAVSNKSFKDLKFKDYRIFLIAGFVISLHYLSWFSSLELTTVTSSTLIICTEPLVALAFGFALHKEKISRRQFAVLMVSLVGVGIVAWGDIYLSTEALIGDALTLLAVVFFVIYLMIGGHVVKTYSFIIYTSILFIGAGIILFIYNIIMGYNMFYLSMNDWLYIILIAIIPNGGQLIFNYVLRYVKSSLIATTILLEPIFATILAIMFLGDSIFANQIIGGVIIIISVYTYLKYEE